MKETLKEFYIDPFNDGDWSDFILGSLTWILSIFVLSAIIALSGWLIDSSFLPLNKAEGIVTRHYFVPAHINTTYVSTGKSIIPMSNYVADSYEITVEIDGKRDDVSLYKSVWDNIKVGDKFCFNYKKGRILNTVYINSFCE